jgi:capsid portal protein
MVVNDNLHWEDQFIGMYWSSTAPNNPLILPPFNPEILMALATRNNVLAQCIEVMEVNIDGTGHEIVPKDVDEEEEADETTPEYEVLQDFFDQPWPGESMVTLRRKLRWELETTGNAYLEVLRNVANEVIFLRVLDSTTMRLVKLDAPVAVEQTIKRGNNEVTVVVQARERRFAQKVIEKLIYFKEFGAVRNINRNTGAFESANNPIPPELRGTEIIHFTIYRDIKTSYGLPRWINNLPSVIGSRKAEEFNQSFSS